eukprot:601283-Amphidinium_carterae.1
MISQFITFWALGVFSLTLTLGEQLDIEGLLLVSTLWERPSSTPRQSTSVGVPSHRFRGWLHYASSAWGIAEGAAYYGSNTTHHARQSGRLDIYPSVAPLVYYLFLCLPSVQKRVHTKVWNTCMDQRPVVTNCRSKQLLYFVANI